MYEPEQLTHEEWMKKLSNDYFNKISLLSRTKRELAELKPPKLNSSPMYRQNYETKTKNCKGISRSITHTLSLIHEINPTFFEDGESNKTIKEWWILSFRENSTSSQEFLTGECNSFHYRIPLTYLNHEQPLSFEQWYKLMEGAIVTNTPIKCVEFKQTEMTEHYPEVYETVSIDKITIVNNKENNFDSRESLTNNLKCDQNTPNSNSNKPNYNLSTPNFNSNKPNHNLSTPNSNINTSNHNSSTPNSNINTSNYNSSTPNFNLNKLKYNPSTPNYNLNKPSTPNINLNNPNTPNSNLNNPNTPKSNLNNPNTPNSNLNKLKYNPSTPNFNSNNPNIPNSNLNKLKYNPSTSNCNINTSNYNLNNPSAPNFNSNKALTNKLNYKPDFKSPQHGLGTLVF